MTPILFQLGLSEEEFAALRRQGFVSRERRCGRTYYRLRFRMPSGKQCTRYLGSDSVTAEQTEDELAQLQAARRVDLELGKLASQAGQKLRASRQRLAGQLKKAGYHFHGLAVRKQRIESKRTR